MTATKTEFASNWQATHPDFLYGATWTCPLCLCSVQAEAPYDDLNYHIESHQSLHKGDWDDYARCA
jgi:hypothetical protein